MAALGLLGGLWAEAATAEQRHIQTYSSADGLAQEQVLAVYQDTTGYLWLGTYGGGASRYDGHGFRTFNLEDGLRSNFVVDFAEDTSGVLWAATEGGGLCSLDGTRFHCIDEPAGLPSSDVRALAADRRYGMWAATAAGVTHVRDGALRSFTTADGLPAAECLEVAVDAAGAVWVGTAAGLARREGGRFIPQWPEALGQRRVGVLLATPEGLVVGTDSGAWLLAGDALRRLDLPPPLAGAEITGTARDAAGALWLTTSRGAVRVFLSLVEAGAEVEMISTADGLPSDSLSGVAVDGEANVWIGSTAGVTKLVPGPFLAYTEADGLPGKYVSAVASDARGRLWIGMPGGGIAIHDGQALRPIPHNETLKDLGVHTLALLRDGRMLAGGRHGLAWFEGERLKRIFRGSDGLPRAPVDSLAADDGGAWLGTRLGLARFQDGRIVAVPPELRQLSVAALANDRQGRLWIGLRSGGVIIYNGREIERLNAKSGLTDQSILDLAPHPDGSMWVASSGEGAFRVAEGKIRRFSTRNGLVDNTVWLVLCDRRGDVWLYTGRGLDRMQGDHVRHYDLGDGLIALEASNGAGWEDEKGDLWFGTGHGLVRFTPHAESINTVPPGIVLEGVDSSHLGLLDPGTHLPPGSDLITFRFSALSYRNPRAVRYRYRIVGLSDHWTGPTAERSLGVASLLPGTYVFEVTGSNDDGVYAREPARFAFVVDPFVWQTWWFRAAAMAALAAALLAAHSWRTRRLRSERLRLELAVAARTVELAGVNQRLPRPAQDGGIRSAARPENKPRCLARRRRLGRRRAQEVCLPGCRPERLAMPRASARRSLPTGRAERP